MVMGEPLVGGTTYGQDHLWAGPLMDGTTYGQDHLWAGPLSNILQAIF